MGNRKEKETSNSVNLDSLLELLISKQLQLLNKTSTATAVDDVHKGWKMLEAHGKSGITTEIAKKICFASFLKKIVIESFLNTSASTVGRRSRGKKEARPRSKLADDLPLFKAQEKFLSTICPIAGLEGEEAARVLVELKTQIYIERSQHIVASDDGLVNILFLKDSELKDENIPVKFWQLFKNRGMELKRYHANFTELPQRYPWHIFRRFLYQALSNHPLIHSAQHMTQLEQHADDFPLATQEFSSIDTQQIQEDESNHSIASTVEEMSEIPAAQEVRLDYHVSPSQDEEGEDEFYSDSDPKAVPDIKDLEKTEEFAQISKVETKKSSKEVPKGKQQKMHYVEDDYENASAAQLISCLSNIQCSSIAHPGLMRKAQDAANKLKAEKQGSPVAKSTLKRHGDIIRGLQTVKNSTQNILRDPKEQVMKSVEEKIQKNMRRNEVAPVSDEDVETSDKEDERVLNGGKIPGFTPGRTEEPFEIPASPEIAPRKGHQKRFVDLFDTEDDVNTWSMKKPRSEAFPAGNENLNNNTSPQPPRSAPAPFYPKTRRSKVRWTDQELELLEEGMKKFNCGWAMIMSWANTERAGFHEHRIPMDLKDKARVEKIRRSRLGQELGIFALASN